jgi:CheY-like chemotaxis protein
MIPNLDGHSTIQKIRELENNANTIEGKRSKIFIISSLEDPKNYALGLFKGQVSAYITKPFSRAEIEMELRKLQ